MRSINLLDCTLRDGGYINNWNWGYRKAKDIINYLVKAQVDIIEVGFLRNVSEYEADITVCNRIEDLNKLLPLNSEKSIFSAMAMRSNYDVSKLSEYNGTGIEMIRITAHDYDLEEGLQFAQQVKNKGYKLSINPINIMGYSDQQILWIVDQVNKILPYQFSIVDTFGSMRRRDLDRIVDLIDHNLEKNIRLGLHLHENMAQSFYLAQHFIDKNIQRDYTIDGSLMGMGRIPGNLSIELIADYMNEYCQKNYDIDYMLDAIQDYIEPIRGKSAWGYTPAYFLSAKYNLHRNYAEFYIEKNDLTIRDINHILAQIDENKKTVFDSVYAEALYAGYTNVVVDDINARKELKKRFDGKKILVIAPGTSIKSEYKIVNKFIERESPIIISLNFIPDAYCVDYAFSSNRKRYDKIKNADVGLITTSNLEASAKEYRLDYNKLSGTFKYGNNSLIMLVRLLSQIGVTQIYLAGADGFKLEHANYFDEVIVNNKARDERFNEAVGQALKGMKVDIEFLTESEYQKYIK